MRLRRYFVVAAAVGAFAVIGVLAYAMLFTQGLGPQLGNQVPWLGHKEASTGTTGQTTQPVGSKGDAPPDGSADGGTATPELPSDLLLLIGVVPVGAGMLLLERRRSRAERR